jgi:pimeloyl-ACP methyl ester carboxylesterase
MSAALLAGAAGAAAWEAARRRDARALAGDPAQAILSDPPRGEPFEAESAGGVTLAGEAYGPPDAPPVVLIHGWTCARRFWTHQVHALSDRQRVIAFDLRGHGRSEARDRCDFSTDALADDVQAVLEATVPNGRRALLVGHSMGAMSIVAWARRHPEQVRERALGAALLNTGMGDLVSESLLLRLPTRMGRAKAAFGRAFLSADVDTGPATPVSRRVVRYVALAKDAPPAAVELTQQLALECPRRVRAGAGRMLTKLDLMDAIAQLDVPTLVLASERDRLTPPVHAERLAAALPQLVEHVTVPRAGHMAPLEAPDAVNAALERLLARVAEPTAVLSPTVG